MPLIDMPCSDEELAEPSIPARDDYTGVITSCKTETGRVMGEENVYHLALATVLDAHPEVPDAEGKAIFSQLPIVAKGSGQFVAFCKLFGKRPSEFNTDEALGKRLKVRVTASERNGQLYNNIKRFSLPDDEVAL